MSGIYQRQVNSGSVAAPSAGRTLISVNETGELFTKDSSGNVIVYPTSSAGGGGGSPFPFTGSADISGTLNIDFTDTLSYITEEDYSITYSDGSSFSGSVMGSKITKDDYSLIEAIGDGNFIAPGGFVTFPQQFSGQSLLITSGSASGSFMINQISKIDTGGITTGFLNQRVTEVIEQASGNTISYRDRMSIDGFGHSSFRIEKVIGPESVNLTLSNNSTGFNLQNNLSDNSASVLSVEDNNGNAILEFFNNYLVSETIPSLDYADDAAASGSGVPIGGIYHNSGSIRIRLT